MCRFTGLPQAATLFGTAIFVACGGSDSPTSLTDDGTGVPGLDTPEQILSNPHVDAAIDEAREEGVLITPEHGLNPPVISGTYTFTGEAVTPGYHPWTNLTPGTWRWYNQTSNNHIDTEYDQLGVQSGSGGGEIIRGIGNRFTVYSVLNVTTQFGDDSCEEQAILIIDGSQDNSGDVSAVYVITPSTAAAECMATTIGRLELTLSGAASPPASAPESESDALSTPLIHRLVKGILAP